MPSIPLLPKIVSWLAVPVRPQIRPAFLLWPLAAVLAILGPLDRVHAESFGFVETGSMNTARTSHTATLLSDGRVLVTGGYLGTAYLASAELYDPTTGTWTPTGAMHTGRANHGAALLPDGKVLVAGGLGSGGTALATAELYDPVSGTWTVTGSMTTPRAAAATLLPTGKVLVAGGGGTVTSAELYDPASGAWTSTGDLPTFSSGQRVALLLDGRVLTTGAGSGDSASSVYDPIAGTWSATGSLREGRYSYAVALLQNGKVLVAGGLSLNSLYRWASIEIYDPSTGEWTSSGAMKYGKSDLMAATLPSGKVLLAGGVVKDTNGPYVIPNAELYDPATAVTTDTGRMVTARTGGVATVLADGRVLITGGVDKESKTLASAEIYDAIHSVPDPLTGTWSATGNLVNPRQQHAATLLPSGKVLVFGGSDANSRQSAELYDSATGTWTATGSLTTGRASPVATLLPNGKVLASGGLSPSGAPAGYELYDPGTGTWSALTDGGTIGHTATLLLNGEVLDVGGEVRLPDGRTYDSAGVARYVPATETWVSGGYLVGGRGIMNHTATLLPNGKVLVVGTSTQLYDPATGTSSGIGGMSDSLQRHTATLLPDGKVLVAGGESNGVSSISTKLYDPSTGLWNSAGSLAIPRYDATATSLPDGSVLMAGGGRGLFDSLSSTERYDPKSGQWTVPRPMLSARRFHTATLLSDGRVLVVGGAAGAEIFDPGLNSSGGTAPQITDVGPVRSGSAIVLSGTNLLGDPQTASSVVVQLRNIANGLTATLQRDPAVTPSATSVTTLPVYGVGTGYLLVTVLAGGVPSTSVVALAEEGGLTLITSAATNLSSKGATLQAYVNTGGVNTSVAFAYSTDPALAQNVTTTPLIQTGTANQVVSQPILGLAAHKTYYFRSAAGNSLGSANGAIVAFTTLNTAPQAPNASVTSVVGSTQSVDLTFPLVDADGDPVALENVSGDFHVDSITVTGRRVTFRAASVGTATLTYRVSDGTGAANGSATGTITVTIVPNEAPVITVAGDNPLSVAYGSVYTDPGASAMNSDGSSVPVITTGSVNTTVAGNYTITYTATNAAGKTATATRAVTVWPAPPEDLPVITISGPSSLTVPFGSIYTDAGASARDKDGNNVAVIVAGTVNAHVAGDYTITYSATDSLLRKAIATRIVTVSPEPPPTPPEAIADRFFIEGLKNVPVSLPVLANDVAHGVSPLLVVGVSGAQYGLTTVAPNRRSIIYTPHLAFSKNPGIREEITYTIQGDRGSTASAQIILTDTGRKGGVYVGMLKSGDMIAGYAKLTLTSTGLFTGTVKLGVKSWPVHGKLGLDNRAILSVPGANVTLTYASQDTMTATVVQGTLTVSGNLARPSDRAGSEPAAQAGTYSVLLPASAELTGTPATASVSWAGATMALSLTAGGSGYIASPLVTVLAPSGSGAVVTAVVMNGAVTSLTMGKAGSGYPRSGVSVLIDSPADTVPLGSGYARMKVSATGAMTLVGRLGDGTPVAGSGMVGDDGTVAFYSIVAFQPGPAGTLVGTLAFNPMQDVSDCDGLLSWTKPPQMGVSTYRNGFFEVLHIVGARYVAPPFGVPALLFTNGNSGQAAFHAEGGDMVSDLSATVAVSRANVVKETSSTADHLVVKIDPATGVMTGSFTGKYPTGTATTKSAEAKFFGIVFPKQNKAEGLVLGPRHTGKISLLPQ